MVIKQGDVFWVELAEPKGREAGYRRPHVVVQSNLFNQSQIGTVLLCTLTSNLKLAKVPGNVFLKIGEASLPKDSVVNVAQMITIDKSELVEKIGRLLPSRIKQIVDGIHLMIDTDY